MMQHLRVAVWVALALCTAACGDRITGPDRYERFRLVEFAASSDASTWSTADTVANQFRLELTGTASQGAVRAEGEWWSTARSQYGEADFPVLYGPYRGTYAVWGDTLRLELRDQFNRGAWLNTLDYRRDGGDLVGRYDQDGFVVRVRFRP